MIAVVMCGGKGTRMASSTEKSLLKLGCKTLVEHVLDALVEYGRFKSITALSSPNTPATSKFLRSHKYHTSGQMNILEGSGVNYSLDLSYAIEKIRPSPIFVVSADLPLLNSSLIHRIMAHYSPCFPCTSVVLETGFVRSFDILPSSVLTIGEKEYCYSGILLIDSSRYKTNSELEENYLIINEKGIAININTVVDLDIAERLLYS
jgi:adenosylcobinamide-phosphate guanylyltransferase